MTVTSSRYTQSANTIFLLIVSTMTSFWADACIYWTIFFIKSMLLNPIKNVFNGVITPGNGNNKDNIVGQAIVLSAYGHRDKPRV
jgi:hypothetical protein